MSGFHDVRFPLRVALGASGGPVRRTDIVNLSNGREQRNQRWRDSRRSYDAGSGIRSLADLYAVLEFFEARRGQLYGFRFRDPVDWASCPPGGTVAATDQIIGTGDGMTAAFQLVKAYQDAGGGWTRRIVKPALDILMDEPQERYRIDLMAHGDVVRSVEVAEPSFSYAAEDELTDFGERQTSIDFAVRQMGRAVPLGIPARSSINL
ncbi:DUF2460 domain-containing protein [Rhizobium sp.]|uniref:DUF2460 domain-containing protein n=1 Tax=Rhizobium sp. TaxID=391 RepID=UPI0028A1F045